MYSIEQSQIGTSTGNNKNSGISSFSTSTSTSSSCSSSASSTICETNVLDCASNSNQRNQKLTDQFIQKQRHLQQQQQQQQKLVMQQNQDEYQNMMAKLVAAQQQQQQIQMQNQQQNMFQLLNQPRSQQKSPFTMVNDSSDKNGFSNDELFFKLKQQQQQMQTNKLNDKNSSNSNLLNLLAMHYKRQQQQQQQQQQLNETLALMNQRNQQLNDLNNNNQNFPNQKLMTSFQQLQQQLESKNMNNMLNDNVKASMLIQQLIMEKNFAQTNTSPKHAFSSSVQTSPSTPLAREQQALYNQQNHQLHQLNRSMEVKAQQRQESVAARTNEQRSYTTSPNVNSVKSNRHKEPHMLIQKNLVEISSEGCIKNIPPNMILDQYGMLGLIMMLRHNENTNDKIDRDISILLGKGEAASSMLKHSSPTLFMRPCLNESDNVALNSTNDLNEQLNQMKKQLNGPAMYCIDNEFNESLLNDVSSQLELEQSEREQKSAKTSGAHVPSILRKVDCNGKDYYPSADDDNDGNDVTFDRETTESNVYYFDASMRVNMRAIKEKLMNKNHLMLSHCKEDLLFYIFYSCCKHDLQHKAFLALYKRNWFFSKDLGIGGVWLKSMSNETTSDVFMIRLESMITACSTSANRRLPKMIEISGKSIIDRNSFFYFDVAAWQIKAINLVWN